MLRSRHPAKFIKLHEPCTQCFMIFLIYLTTKVTELSVRKKQMMRRVENAMNCDKFENALNLAYFESFSSYYPDY